MEKTAMSERRVATAAQLKSASQPKPRDVAVPELGEGVVVPVWPMTALEWTRFQLAQQDKDGKPNPLAKQVRQRLVVKCCRTDDGQPIFTSEDIDDIGKMNAGIVERLVDAALEVSGLKTAASIDTAAKNSEETQDA